MWIKIVSLLSLALFPVICFAFEMKHISFIQEGEISKVIFDFNQKGVRASKFQNDKDKQIILDFEDVVAIPQVMRAFDTSEFDGATVFVSPYKKPGSPKDIRVAIQLRDNVRSLLEVIGNKLVLNIENRFGVFSEENIKGEKALSLQSDLKKNDGDLFTGKIHVPKSDSIEDILENLTLSGQKRYIGKRIHFDVKNIEVGDLLKMIADASGFNIVVDSAVNSATPVTLSLVNIPWDQALDTLLELSKLEAKKNGNILIVTTQQKANEERKNEMAAKKLLEAQEPLLTKIFPISYASSSELIKTLKEYATKGRGKFSFDNRTNQLIVKDTAETIERIGKMIEVLDTQTPQILIEAKIVEATEGFSQRIGFSNGFQTGYNFTGPSATGSSGQFTFSSTSGYKVGNEGSSTFLGIDVNVFKRLTGLNMTLELMETEGKGRVVTTPKVITQNKQTASIVNTFTTSYAKNVTTSTGAGGVVDIPPTITYETISAPLSLSVTPQVTNEGSIIMQVAIQKGALTPYQGNNRPPDKTDNNISTNVLVDNGSTIVIGGIYSLQEREGHQGIPFLKDIPLLGWLFRTAYNPSKEKQELIIFLTPRIINAGDAGLEAAGASEENPLG